MRCKLCYKKIRSSDLIEDLKEHLRIFHPECVTEWNRPDSLNTVSPVDKIQSVEMIPVTDEEISILDFFERDDNGRKI